MDHFYKYEIVNTISNQLQEKRQGYHDFEGESPVEKHLDSADASSVSRNSHVHQQKVLSVTQEIDPVQFYYVSKSRHLNLNQLLSQAFIEE